VHGRGGHGEHEYAAREALGVPRDHDEIVHAASLAVR
jgi:hypothetical protein